jgi:ribosome-binding factor A
MNSGRRYPRTARLNEVMLEVLADEVERLSDPRLGFVTLTGVDVNRDVTKATVFYSTLAAEGEAANDDDAGAAAAATARALESATPHLRAVLGRQVRTKHVPRLQFVPDPGIVSGQRIEAILREIHAQEHNERAGEL